MARITAAMAPGGRDTSGMVNEVPPMDVTQTPSAVTARTVKLTVNGRKYNLQVEPNWPLRDVLRQKLGLTSSQRLLQRLRGLRFLHRHHERPAGLVLYGTGGRV